MDATDLAFAGVARQAELIAAGEVSVARAGATLPRAHRAPRPAAQRLPRRRSPSGRWRRPTRPTRRRRAGDAAAAARRAGRDQGRHRRRRRGDRARAPTRRRRPRAADAEVVRRLRAAGAVVLGKTQRARADDQAVHRVADVRRHPQPVGPRAHAGRVERRLGAPRSPPGCAASRSAPTAPGRSASRPRAAACSASSRSAAACRSPPRERRAGTGMSTSAAPITRTVADAALFLDAIARRRPEAASPTRRRAPPGRLRIAVVDEAAAGRRGAARRRAARRRRGDRRRCCARSATRSSSASSTTARAWAANVLARYLRGVARRGARRSPHPERLARAHARRWRGIGGADPAGAIARPRARRGRRPPRGQRASSATADVDADCPMPGAAPLRVGQYDGRGALRTLNGVAGARAVLRRRSTTPASRPCVGARRASTGDGFPLARAARRAARRRGDAALARRPARGRAAWADRRPRRCERRPSCSTLAEAAAREAGALLRERSTRPAAAGVDAKSTPTDLGLRGRPRGRAPIRERLAAARPDDGDPGRGGRRRRGRRAGCAGSSTRSTARSTSSSASRSGR